jgi:hypothetical protein
VIEIGFQAWCKAYGIPPPKSEYRFHPKRKWRFDFSWPENLVAVEVQGGVWTHGKHGRASGIVKDYEKLNSAQILGWIVLQILPSDIKNGSAATTIIEALKSRMTTRDHLSQSGAALTVPAASRPAFSSKEK